MQGRGKSTLLAVGAMLWLCSSDLIVRATDSVNLETPLPSDNESPVCESPDQLNNHDDDDSSSDDIAYETPTVEWCRRRPAWRDAHQEIPDQIIREACQKVLGYQSNLQELANHPHPLLQVDQEMPVLERPIFQQLVKCMEDATKTRPTTTTSKMKRPSLAKLYRRRDGLPIMGIVQDALSEEEAGAVLGLARCLPHYFPESFRHRDFAYTEEGGGNDVTFLTGFLQILAPGVAHSVQTAAKLVWEKAQWGLDDRPLPPIDAHYSEDGRLQSNYSSKWWPDPVSECGIRTTEHLSYDRWQGLGFHEDGGSDYTVLVALSDPSDYQGGAFSLCPEYQNNPEHHDPDDASNHQGRSGCPDMISVKPNKRSAIVFLSEFSHGVECIESPGRVMFANELWRYGDVPATQYRPEAHDFVLGDYSQTTASTYG